MMGPLIQGASISGGSAWAARIRTLAEGEPCCSAGKPSLAIRTSDLVGATAGVALLGGLCLLLVALFTSEAQGFTDLASILPGS